MIEKLEELYTFKYVSKPAIAKMLHITRLHLTKVISGKYPISDKINTDLENGNFTLTEETKNWKVTILLEKQ